MKQNKNLMILVAIVFGLMISAEGNLLKTFAAIATEKLAVEDGKGANDALPTDGSIQKKLGSEPLSPGQKVIDVEHDDQLKTTDFEVCEGVECNDELAQEIQNKPAKPGKKRENTTSVKEAPNKPTVLRFNENPIIRPDMLPGPDGVNINGPSIFRAPDWLEKPLGKYYLYFANHRGTYIRLAYSEELAGPWTIYKPGTLTLEDLKSSGGYEITDGHIASPNVLVDHEKKEFRMYFHAGMKKWGHQSGVAISKDGIHFKPESKPIGEPYFRVFQRDGSYYAITRSGSLARSKDGLGPFETGNNKFGKLTQEQGSDARIRHVGLLLDGNTLSVYFSRGGDKPESIMLSTAQLKGDWKTWRLSTPVKILEPELEYEGVNLPFDLPRSGTPKLTPPVLQLRDPEIFRENGKTYLLYSVAGEQGIAIAKLKD